MAYNPKEYRYQYEKEKLKRIALDVNKESEYIPFKEYCDEHGIAVSGMIRKLMKRELLYPGLHLLDMISEDQYNELNRITQQHKTNIKDLITSAISKYINKHKESPD